MRHNALKQQFKREQCRTHRCGQGLLVAERNFKICDRLSPAVPLRAVCRGMKFDLRGASNTHRLTLTERARDQNFINRAKIRDVYNCG